LHDAAKDLSENQINLLVSEGHIQIQHECEADYANYLHGPVGAYLIQKEFGITDQEIIDVIYVHTFCDCSRNFNNPLSWCMRFSDLIEPNRDWSAWDWMEKGTRELRKTAFQGDYQKAALLHLDLVIKLFKVNDVPIHPNVYLAIEHFSPK
jgi:HD superfamily phosphohydrolase YqeK